MKLNKNKLKTKGWTDEEIDHAEKILVKAEEKKHPQKIFLEKLSFWLLLFVLIVLSISLGWVIQPILLLTSTFAGFVVVGIAGFLFGSFASLTLWMIGKIELKHHLILNLIIPVSAIVTSIFINAQTNKVASSLNMHQHSSVLFALIYVVASFIPYIFFLILQKRYS